MIMRCLESVPFVCLFYVYFRPIYHVVVNIITIDYVHTS